jgi:hypothetical protein
LKKAAKFVGEAASPRRQLFLEIDAVTADSFASQIA